MAVQDTDTTETATELELQITDPDCFFISASEAAECQITLEHLSHRSDGRLLEFFAVDGVDPTAVVDLADNEPGIAEARLVGDTIGGLVQFVVSEPCVTQTLADAGAVALVVTASDGIGRVVADVPPHADVRTVVETFQERHPDSELLASRQSSSAVPIRTDLGLKETLAGRLTDRQLEVVRTAYLRGYFEWPRESTAEECAAALDITQPTFSQHMRAAQQSISECLFES